MITIIIDFLATSIEAIGFLYLVKNENITKTRKFIFGLFEIAFAVFLTNYIIALRIDVKIILVLLSLIILGKFILKLTMAKSIFYFTIGVLLLLTSELITMQVELLFNLPSIKTMVVNIEEIIASKTVFLILICLVQRIISDISQQKLKMKTLVLFFFSNIGYSCVAICINLILVSLQDRFVSFALLACSIIILVAFVANIVFTDKFLSLEAQEQKHNMAIFKLQLQAKYYEEKANEEEKIKQIYHDMKNHLLVLEQIDGVQLEDICKLRQDIKQYEIYYRTGNKALDIILKDKLVVAQKYNIELEDNIDLNGVNFLETLDISTIFGNLIDNAIEANTVHSTVQRKYIKISAAKKQHFLVICIINSKVPEKKIKKKKVIHGYGLLNVTDAVHKYSGEITIKNGDKEYIVNIIIPIPEVEFK